MKPISIFRMLFGLLMAVLFGACQNENNQVVKETTESFFSTTRMHNEIDQQALSTDLAALLQQAIEAETNDAALTKAGPFPTDKPMLIEGDIFSSLYEGRTSAKVKSIRYKDNNALVVMDLENKPYNTKWSDTAVLTKEGNTWKIDNVLFGQNNNMGNTKAVLNNFLNACRDKLKQRSVQ
ncbi:MAG: DUF3828 domain-containing protein [Chitinophagaceae bacterium]|nr:DUF3828 domain-containing protein [Chitinophagaceae bacterium]